MKRRSDPPLSPQSCAPTRAGCNDRKMHAARRIYTQTSGRSRGPRPLLGERQLCAHVYPGQVDPPWTPDRRARPPGPSQGGARADLGPRVDLARIGEAYSWRPPIFHDCDRRRGSSGA
eukprot:3360719-Pyramimonas_sp.AAC.1